ncbi:MAG: lamin tail domain-containing protein [Myxococcota bacterium]|nr:lamin tail domain-containing protein [Myxococcota bacterium]
MLLLRDKLALLVLVALFALGACSSSPQDDDDSAVDDDDSTADDDDSAADDDDSTADDDDSAVADDDDSAGDDDDSAPPGGIAPGALIVTEIFNNPAGTDEGREWFEVHNPGLVAIDMDGWTLADYHTNEYLISGSVLVAPGGYAVLGESMDLGLNLGTPVDFAYGLTAAGFPLGNNTDEVVLVSPGGLVIDSVAYDGGTTFPSAEGAALNLAPKAMNVYANDMGWNWCLSTAGPFTAEGDLGSPGEANPDC